MITATETRVERRTQEDYRQLARELRERGIRPARSARDMWALARDRRAARELAPRRSLMQRLAERYIAEIDRRRGEVRIETERGHADVTLGIVDHRDGLTLLHCEGWRAYSRSFGNRHASLSYLCGRDDAGLWAVRVPGTIITVADGLAYLEPAAVSAARAKGRRVIRQGEVYAVESVRDSGLHRLPAGHTWAPATRLLSHEGGHAPLHVPFRARFIAQNGLGMGRGAGRRYRD